MEIGITFKKITISFLLTFLVIIAIPPIYAQTSEWRITANEDSSVDQDNPETDELVGYKYVEKYPYKTFGEWIFLSSGWSNDKDGPGVMQTLAYMKFEMSKEMQTSDLLNDVKTDAYVELMLQEIKGKGQSALVTLIPCFDNSWDETIKWENRKCANNIRDGGVDSILIHEDDLPNRFLWDVSNSIIEAKKLNMKNMTFIVSSLPMDGAKFLQISEDDLEAELDPTIVYIWSSELIKFGNYAVPTLIIQQDVQSSTIGTGINYFLVTILPTLAIIVPIGIWLYNRSKK